MTAPQEKPRLYFDCPMKAAWMMARHGFKITNRDGVLLVNVGIGLVLDYANREHVPLVYHPSGEPCFILPESLPLLEPIEDDIILRTNGYCQQVGWQIGLPKAKAQIEAGATIIQRNGLAFHWPDSEAA